jgi:ketosteroid isomerase-like protein
MAFDALLARFSAAVQAHDSQGLAALFTPDGVYDDYFFGRHAGRPEIAAMLDRFHVGGERFCWEFLEPLCAGDLGYARYCFSYLSREPGTEGRLVMFDGIARMRLRDGLIADYAEAFDRGMAFAQLGYPPDRIARLAARYAAALHASPMAAHHLEVRAARLGGAPAI